MRIPFSKAPEALLRLPKPVSTARAQLGATGEDNAEIQQAVAVLGAAELALEWTELRAPARGLVVDLAIAEGTLARAGHSLISFVSFDEVWVEAYMTENNIANISVGNPVELSLDLYPGRIFDGVVSSITMAASDGTPPAGLPSPARVDGWMRDPQRFHLRIAIPGSEIGSEQADIRRMLKGQADVIVYTGDGSLLRTLGAGWIHLMSTISYAY